MRTMARRWLLRLEGAAQWVQARRWLLAGVALALAALAFCFTLVSVATAPSRWMGPPSSLAAAGRPYVVLRLGYPLRLAVDEDHAAPVGITLFAQALQPQAQEPFDLYLALSDPGLAFVDASGRRVPGQIRVSPGYPETAPHEILVIHEDTQFRSRGLRAARVTITPTLLADGDPVALRDLAFQIRLMGRGEATLRRAAQRIAQVALPGALLGGLLLAAAWLWQQIRRQQRAELERRLSGLYTALQGYIKLESWADARRAIEQIQAASKGYRDIDRLEAQVSAAETAAWRRERLYDAGVRAYKSRDWPSAVQSFGAIEEETPYYRDVRFLRRTAALYADLQSRDRSLRIAAATQLGQVADLVDMAPLLQALGDHAPEVAEAAEASFRRIGLAAVDALLGGLAHDAPAIRERSYRLIEALGQSARSRLAGALRSSQPRVTAAAARLLASLGARQELADALTWAAPEHQEGIVQALLGEGVAACEALLRTLPRVPAARQPVIIAALAALRRQREDVERYIEETLRRTKDPTRREQLQRVLKAPAEPFTPSGMVADMAITAESVASEDGIDQSSSVQRLRLLDSSPRSS